MGPCRTLQLSPLVANRALDRVIGLQLQSTVSVAVSSVGSDGSRTDLSRRSLMRMNVYVRRTIYRSWKDAFSWDARGRVAFYRKFCIGMNGEGRVSGFSVPQILIRGNARALWSGCGTQP